MSKWFWSAFVGCMYLGPIDGLRAQVNDIPLQRDFYIDVERNAAKIDARVHSGMKPVNESRADLANVMGYRVDSAKYYYWATEKLFRDHLLEVKGEDYRLTLDPLFEFGLGTDPSPAAPFADTTQYFQNTRGFRVTGDLGSKLSFQTMFHENQAILPQYMWDLVRTTGVVPGQGRAKIESTTKLDYGWSQSSLTYAPVDWLQLQLGRGQHFVGHGYRSVLLSDNSVTVPYLQFSAATRNRRLQYTTWHSKLMHGVVSADRLPTGNSSESLFRWMRSRTNHLSVLLGRFDIGLFESTIFKNIDANGVMPFDPLELNPVIGINSLLSGFDGDYKNLVGLDLRTKVTDRGYVYGQLATDRPGERAAWQVGLRWFDVLRKDLHLQVEFNHADPFMYMHSDPQQAYMHAGLPMAHPMGSNFQEAIGIVDAGFGRWRVQGKVNLGWYSRDREAGYNEGSNLNKPDRPDPSPEGPLEQQVFNLDLNGSWLINPVSNLRAVVGFLRRDLTPAGNGQQSSMIYVTVRTALFNRYYDL